jgi:multicomponent Na+:H+ antiporter subunit E
MSYITVFILSLLFWLLITFRITLPNIVAGSVAAAICSAVFARFYFHNVYKFLQPKRYFWSLIYLAVFIWSCIKANFDVAYRVLHPAMPIKPGIVKVKTSLTSDFNNNDTWYDNCGYSRRLSLYTLDLFKIGGSGSLYDHDHRQF